MQNQVAGTSTQNEGHVSNDTFELCDAAPLAGGGGRAFRGGRCGEGDDAGGSIKGNIGRYYDSLFTVEKHRMHSEEVKGYGEG